MLGLTLITQTTDPGALWATYRELSTRYDHAQAQLDELQVQLDVLDRADDEDERQRLAGELDRLGVAQAVLLGWVSAFFAAYTFAVRGTDTLWLDPGTRTSARYVDASDGTLRPLTAAVGGRSRGLRS